VNQNLTFQAMNQGEEKQVFELIKSVFEEYVAPDFSPEGVKNFMDFILPDAILNRKNSDRYFLITAKDEDKIIGMIEVQNSNHICLLFVSKDYHNQGIAKKLYALSLEKCKQFEAGLKEMEVNSSRYAVPVYEKLGFKRIAEEQISNGIIFNPMKANI
jgi:ribosomal protein S18 acetylase RimI-like enzyme